jgi:hypothetical protein
MKWMDWLIVLLLVVVGVFCLTMSATWMMGPDSIHYYLMNFLQICLWIGLPILAAGIIYYVLRRKKGES